MDGLKPDFDGTIPTSIIPAPANPTVNYDFDVWAETAPGATSLTTLGTLSMGSGREDHPATAYTCSTIVAAQAPSNLTGLQYQWQRWKVRRSWFIRMITSSSSPYYGQRYVTQRSEQGVPVPVTDIDQSQDDHNTVPNSTNHEFYFYDDSALQYGNYPGDKGAAPANSSTTYMNVGDFIHEEKVFAYQVQTSFDGTNWTYGVVMPVTQTITVKYKATGGNAATDWDGWPSQAAGNTYTVGNSLPIINADKVRAIVGGTAMINIDPTANN